MTFQGRIGEALVHQVTELDCWPFAPEELFLSVRGSQRAAIESMRPASQYVNEEGLLILAIHTYLVKLGDRSILIDTGNGNLKNRPGLPPHHMFTTDYMERLAATGIHPDEVDTVVCTHLHPDHCGWSTTLEGGSWVSTFKNANYIYSKKDLRSLQRLAAGKPAGGIDGDLARTYWDSVEPVLLSNRWECAEPGKTIASHGDTAIGLIECPGHTPGHMIVDISHPEGGAIFSGDAIHHPLQLSEPDLIQAGDADPGVARQSREKLLERCVQENKMLLTAHFAGDGFTSVIHNADGYTIATT